MEDCPVVVSSSAQLLRRSEVRPMFEREGQRTTCAKVVAGLWRMLVVQLERYPAHGRVQDDGHPLCSVRTSRRPGPTARWRTLSRERSVTCPTTASPTTSRCTCKDAPRARREALGAMDVLPEVGTKSAQCPRSPPHFPCPRSQPGQRPLRHPKVLGRPVPTRSQLRLVQDLRRPVVALLPDHPLESEQGLYARLWQLECVQVAVVAVFPLRTSGQRCRPTCTTTGTRTSSTSTTLPSSSKRCPRRMPVQDRG